MKRLGNIFRAIFSAFLGKAEQKNAGAILDLGYEQLQNMLIEVKRQLANVATSKARIAQLVNRNKDETAKLEGLAKQFLEQGDEAKATEALQRKAYVTEQLGELQAQLDHVASEQKDLEASQGQLETRIEQFASTKELTKARIAAGEAQAKIGETVTGISKSAMDLGRTVARLEERADMLEARGEGLKELIANGSLDDMFNPGQTPLSRAGLELTRTASVTADLERLKKEIGPGTPSPETADTAS